MNTVNKVTHWIKKKNNKKHDLSLEKEKCLAMS